MEEGLAARLLTSIETDRLVIFCGAGLSMAAPSSVPSARRLAEMCSVKYQEITGSPVPGEAKEDLERLAEFFHAQGNFHSLFLQCLIPWYLFRQHPNRGHVAIADFLASGVIEFGLTTNVDTLIEIAAEKLGQLDFQAALDGNEANRRHREHNPFLKLHGCWLRERDSTLWCSSQLREGPLKDRINSSKDWLRGYLRNRDLLLIGFWSDWAYLNHVLEDCVSTVEAGLVILVDPGDAASLKVKAPALWNWANSGEVDFLHLQESGADVLDELRRRFSQRFIERLLQESLTTFQGMTTVTFDGPITLGPDLTADELYSLRRDFSGKQGSNVPLAKRPHPGMHQLGATHLLLVKQGATLAGASYLLQGMRIRLVHGAGELLSSVKNRFSDEPPPPMPFDLVICVGAYDDGGVPTNIVREQKSGNIMRGGTSGEWLTIEQARERLGV